MIGVYIILVGQCRFLFGPVNDGVGAAHRFKLVVKCTACFIGQYGLHFHERVDPHGRFIFTAITEGTVGRADQYKIRFRERAFDFFQDG